MVRTPRTHTRAETNGPMMTERHVRPKVATEVACARFDVKDPRQRGNRTPVIESVIVIVDEAGNETPFDPSTWWAATA